MAEDFDLLGLDCLTPESNKENLNFIHYNSLLWDLKVEKQSEKKRQARVIDSNAKDYSESLGSYPSIPKENKSESNKPDRKYQLCGKIINLLIFTQILFVVVIMPFLYTRDHHWTKVVGSQILFQNQFNNNKQGISLLLDFSSNESQHASNILTRCFHLKSAPIEKLIDKKDSKKVDFFTAKSLCDVPKSLMSHPDFRFFLFLANPIIPIVEKYKNEVNKRTNKNKRLTLKKYILSSNKNTVTRSILCKMNDELNSKDLDMAKQILEDKSHVGFVNYHMSSMKMFQEKFNRKSADASSEKCIKDYIDDVVYKEASLIDGSTAWNIEQMYKSNSYDFDLYMEYINKFGDST